VERQITDESLAAALCIDGNPTAVDLRGNELGDEGARKLAALLTAEHCAVEDLRLWSNRIGSDGCGSIIAALEVNATLTSLDLGKQQHDEDGFGDLLALKLAAVLHTNRTLTAIDLRYTRMTDAGAVELASALPHSPTLRQLDLRYNVIGATGLRALAVGLTGVEQTRVYVKANAYDDHDAAELADWLEADPKRAPLAQGQERFWF
jgi:Ran GTPase-activating protein (RanGAP) involved in mRNA processing and transport